MKAKRSGLWDYLGLRARYDEKEQARRKARASVVQTVRRAILDHVDRMDRNHANISGVIRCPVCGGSVQFQYLGAYSGTMSAKCSGQGCVDWIE